METTGDKPAETTTENGDTDDTTSDVASFDGVVAMKTDEQKFGLLGIGPAK